jgi:hypothetical protein
MKVIEEPRVLGPTKSNNITEQFRVNNSSPIDTKFGKKGSSCLLRVEKINL